MKTKVKSNIKNNLKKYRQWKFITQEDLADELNISTTQLRMIETENHYPKYQVRSKICNYFGVSQEQMFYEEVTE
jgi:DNA-binding XRE family transcriptional regulator